MRGNLLTLYNLRTWAKLKSMWSDRVGNSWGLLSCIVTTTWTLVVGTVSLTDINLSSINISGTKCLMFALLSIYLPCSALFSSVNYLTTFSSRAKTKHAPTFFFCQMRWKKNSEIQGKSFSLFIFYMNSVTYKIRSVKWKSERAACGWLPKRNVFPQHVSQAA